MAMTLQEHIFNLDGMTTEILDLQETLDYTQDYFLTSNTLYAVVCGDRT